MCFTFPFFSRDKELILGLELFNSLVTRDKGPAISEGMLMVCKSYQLPLFFFTLRKINMDIGQNTWLISTDR